MDSTKPDWDSRKDILVAVAKSTCYLGVWAYDEAQPTSGTAFFVTPDILLTAGHVVPDRKRRVIVQKPGTREAALLVDDLFCENQGLETFECELLESGAPNVDISVLRVKGEYKSPHFVSIATTVFRKNGSVDLIGYPGTYSTEYVARMMRQTGANRSALVGVPSLFPHCKLIISYGKVAEEGHRPTYHLSTVPGMSGSPIVLAGHVVGEIFNGIS